MKGFFFPLLAKNVDNIEFVSKQNHCKILNAIALGNAGLALNSPNPTP